MQQSHHGHQRAPPVFVMIPPGREAQNSAGAINATATAVKILGVVQFLTAFPCIALGVGAQSSTCQNGYIMVGIWTGTMFLFAGVLGIGAGSSKDQCTLSCCHMLSIIGILVATAQVAISVMAVLHELTVCADITATCPALCLTFDTLLFTVGVVLFILALTLAVVSILLNSKINTSKEQVAPYPFHMGAFSSDPHHQGPRNRPALAAAPLEPTQGSSRNESREDTRVREVDYGDEGFKFK
ncbi:uncharacterized protein LOC117301119 [Asterias rubens]|uniref:uncharacterized protein LOC117301119 n=1 Tax=Asterias rubens TaxID=7604 RepID=UPI001454F3FB|nr:uncharacterized protein LOC117301119 [Asterias rubens]